MCLYPRFIKNKTYYTYISKKPNKGASTAKPCNDYRKLYVPIGCGECYECRRQKAQQWRVRMLEEIKVQKYKYFVTLTFSNDELEKLANELGIMPDSNAVATLAVRRMLERYRKKYKVSCRHWLITELGHENTERIHLHGILMPEHELTNEELTNLWKYGRTDIGEYCNERTINYIVKYVTKIDTDHKNFKSVILCSAGLGSNFINRYDVQALYKYKKGETPEYYKLNDGNKVALPIYYRNKLFSHEERDEMWTDRLDKGSIYVNGIEIQNIESNESQEYYYNLLAEQQKWNEAIGYGNTSKEWQKEPYNITFKMLQRGNYSQKR